MVNLALMDRVLEVDKEKKTVRVEAGIRVQQLVDGIKDDGLTLQNFASIREQQIGGIVQVGFPCFAFLFFSGHCSHWSNGSFRKENAVYRLLLEKLEYWCGIVF